MGFDPGTMLQLAAAILPHVLGGGQKDKLRQVPTKSPKQLSSLEMSLDRLNQLAGPGYENALGLLQDYLNPESEAYKNFEAPYLSQFYQQIMPQLSEQFAGADRTGMGGAMQSSGFAQAQGAAGANLVESLAKLREQMRMGAAKDLLGQYNTQFGQTMGVDPFAITRERGGQGVGQGALTGALRQLGTDQLMNQRGGRGGAEYPTQNPLTNEYNALFRTGQIGYT